MLHLFIRMSRKRIFSCDRCIQLFSGRVAFDYHMNAHRRTDPPKRREVAPKSKPIQLTWSCGTPVKPGETALEHIKHCPVWYYDGSGNESATEKENPTCPISQPLPPRLPKPR